MLQFYADKFVAITGLLAKLTENYADGLRDAESISPNSVMSWLSEIRHICADTGLEYAVMKIDSLEKSLTHGFITIRSELHPHLIDLEGRIYDELKTRFFLTISSEKAKFYETTNLFGNDVLNNFASAGFDIEEAGKCFATSRFTACVMHLQRVLEVSLKAYGLYLGIAALVPGTQPSWNKILDQTRNEIKERNDKKIPTKTWHSTKEKDFCEGLQPFLEAVKIAWRNPSMHADAKYTEDEADDIFSVVKRFMKHLAKHLDEKGSFTP